MTTPIEEVGEQDRHDGDGERDELVAPDLPCPPEMNGVRQLPADVNQDRGQGGQRNAVEHTGNCQQRQYQPHRVEDGACAGATARLDVGGTAHDDPGERERADAAGDEVADALRSQLAVGGRVPLEGVELVGSLEGKERL